MTLRATFALAGLLLSLQLPAQRPAPERIGGTVVSASGGRPIAHATVTLQGSPSDKVLATVTSDANGHFLFDPVSAGKYRLHAKAKGFGSAYYLEHGTFFSAIVTGAGLATGTLQMQLTPAASISGRVVDEAGDPLPVRGSFLAQGSNLTLYCGDRTAPRPIQACGTKQAEEDGSYEFRDLKPGTYYLGAEARPWYEVHPNLHTNQAGQLPYRTAIDPALDVAYPRVFYPNALSSSEAEPIVLKPGDEFTANLQMVPERALTIAIPHPNEPSWNFPLVATEVFGSTELLMPLMDTVDNVSYIHGLPQGHYTLQESRQGSNFVVRTRKVDLLDQTVTLDPVAPAGSGSVSVTLHTIAGEPVPEHTAVSLVQSDAAFAPTFASTEQGTVSFSKVPEGEYRLFPGLGLRVVKLSMNGQPAQNGHIQITAGQALHCEVTVAPGVNVEGVAVSGGKPAPGRLALLVPAGGNTDVELFRRDQTDLDGSFSLLGVVPGRYLLLVLDDGWALPWTDVRALEPYLLHAQPLVVPANGRGKLRLPVPLNTQLRQ